MSLIAAAVPLAALVGFPRTADAAQEIPTLSDSARVSLISILPGDDLYSLFGHSALRVRDPVSGIDVSYNFGTFDFGDSPFAMAEFVTKFTYGDLRYSLTRQDAGPTITWYWQEMGRPAVEQTLALEPAEARELFRRLEINALPENRYYPYDFFFDNCATRLVDVLEAVLGGSLSFQAPPPGRSFRRLLDPFLTANPWVDFGMDLGLGSPADRPATAREATFLPRHLMEYVATGTVDRGDGRPHPLVRGTEALTGPTDAAWTPASVLPWPALLGWALLAAGLGLTILDTRSGRDSHRGLDTLLFGVLGLAGLAIVFLWFISLHTVTKMNLNLFWALPTHLALAVALARGKAGRRAGLYLAATGLLAGVLLVGMPYWPQELPGPAVPLLLLIMVRSGWLAWIHLRTRQAAATRESATAPA